MYEFSQSGAPLSIAVIGSGIAGLSAAWLLSKTHRVTLYEKEPRLGGHANTVSARFEHAETPVDTGFIVYNELNYPNLTALFAALGVPTRACNMSFAVSINGGRTEYSSNDWLSFIGRGRNLFSPRFWSMNFDLLRFYSQAPKDISLAAENRIITLGEYLDERDYGEAFQSDHLLPEAAAIWSSSVRDMRSYPACAFIRFFENHGLLRFSGRPKWRSVVGGSKVYVQRLHDVLRGSVRLDCAAVSVRPCEGGVEVRDRRGGAAFYDKVLIATHSDQALALLDAPDADQRALLGAIPYAVNRAVLHTDPSFMPRSRSAWSAWNYVGQNGASGCTVTYWMNQLQGLSSPKPIFVTLNPPRAPEAGSVLWDGEYEHPCFTPASVGAQRRLWSIQGRRNIWFAGAWFGAGFHEDGLQAGLAAAEEMGAVRRPWSVPNESGRIILSPRPHAAARVPEAAMA